MAKIGLMGQSVKGSSSKIGSASKSTFKSLRPMFTLLEEHKKCSFERILHLTYPRPAYRSTSKQGN